MKKYIFISIFIFLLTVAALYILNVALWPPYPPKSDGAKIQMSVISQILNDYEAEYGNLPSTHQGLNVILTSKAWKWRNKNPNFLLDPWAQPIQYRRIYELRSTGADGKIGSQDDIIFIPDKSDDGK